MYLVAKKIFRKLILTKLLERCYSWLLEVLMVKERTPAITSQPALLTLCCWHCFAAAKAAACQNLDCNQDMSACFGFSCTTPIMWTGKQEFGLSANANTTITITKMREDNNGVTRRCDKERKALYQCGYRWCQFACVTTNKLALVVAVPRQSHPARCNAVQCDRFVIYSRQTVGKYLFSVQLIVQQSIRAQNLREKIQMIEV